MRTFSKKEGATSTFRAPDGFRIKEVPCCGSTDTRHHRKTFSSVDDSCTPFLICYIWKE